MISRKKLVGYIYDSHLRMDQKTRLAGLVIYGYDEELKKIYELVLNFSNDLERLHQQSLPRLNARAAEAKKELDEIFSSNMRKIQHNSSRQQFSSLRSLLLNK